jgi:hypothetical protein
MYYYHFQVDQFSFTVMYYYFLFATLRYYFNDVLLVFNNVLRMQILTNINESSGLCRLSALFELLIILGNTLMA